MYTEVSPERVLRFELLVSGSDYRTLVAHLRGHSVRVESKTRPPKQVRALIDLDPKSNTFSITSIDHHRLPRPVTIRGGSSTHQNLSRALSLEIQRDTQLLQLAPELVAQLQKIIDACPELSADTLRANPRDFELPEIRVARSDEVLTAPILARLAPTLLLEFDDQPTLVIQEQQDVDLLDVEQLLRRELRLSGSATVSVNGNLADIRHSIAMPALSPAWTIDFFAHWGSYEDLSPPWTDELITSVEGLPSPQNISLCFRAHAPAYGWHGATVFAQVRGSSERLWLGKPWLNDAKFFIDQDEIPATICSNHQTQQQRLTAAARIAANLANPTDLSSTSAWLREQFPELSLGELVASAALDTRSEASAISHAFNILAAAGLSHIVDSIRSSYGLGEIVFASPEFSHAGAGGLAQVMTALPFELSKSGIPVTIVTPLYRFQNGNRHGSAEEVLEKGLLIGSTRVVPSYVATLAIPVGPTRYAGTEWNKRPPASVEFKVYRAQVDNVRVFLLSARSIFDRLYQAVAPDEQLRRAIIFSRGVLSTVATEHLGIRPCAIISNDWMTACIPPLASLDPSYQTTPWISSCKTIHMIHNGGADYHGRLPLHVHHEDLWPMFNLAPEHYFGFKDPHRDDLLNLTIAAVRHASGGIITVSQPYAQQLVSPCGGGDGLEYVLHNRRSDVFGVSNGIKRDEIDTYLAARANVSRSELRDCTTLLDAKISIQTAVQQRYGLHTSSSTTLISFVGRLAEQKGLELLSGLAPGTSHSVLEDLLKQRSDIQILIAGPVTPGDTSASALCSCVEYLIRKYPGRIAAVFDYIAHSTALEILGASTIFLMPSRFEPGGISQLEALAVGTLVVGRGVGGIAATITNFDPKTGQGTGFICYDYSAEAFLNTIYWALSVCDDPATYSSLVAQALNARHSWSDRAPTFTAVLQRIILGEKRLRSLPFLRSALDLSQSAGVD
jgi:starch synthase